MKKGEKRFDADVEKAVEAVQEIVFGGDYDSFGAELFYERVIELLQASQDGAACAHEYD